MSFEYSKHWLQTLPSITKAWFYACLTTSCICTIPAFTSSFNLSDSIQYVLNGGLLKLDWSLITHGQLWRLLTPFIVIGAFVPGLIAFTILCLTLIGVYVRELEEQYYLDGSRGAARLTSVLAFGIIMLLVLSQSVVQAPFLALPLLFFVITHLVNMDPWTQLGDSNVLLRWHLPYLLLVPVALTATSMVGQAFIGILIGYAHYVITIRVKERFNIPLWFDEPSWLVRLYESFGIGQPKIGFRASRGHSLVDEPEES